MLSNRYGKEFLSGKKTAAPEPKTAYAQTDAEEAPAPISAGVTLKADTFNALPEHKDE